MDFTKFLFGLFCREICSVPLLRSLNIGFFLIMAKYKDRLLALHFCLNFFTQLLIKSITHAYNYKVDDAYVIY